MTLDFVDDLIAACEKEGATYFIVVSTNQQESVHVFHNYNTLPATRTLPSGETITQKQDFQQLIETIDFTDSHDNT